MNYSIIVCDGEGCDSKIQFRYSGKADVETANESRRRASMYQWEISSDGEICSSCAGWKMVNCEDTVK